MEKGEELSENSMQGSQITGMESVANFHVPGEKWSFLGLVGL